MIGHGYVLVFLHLGVQRVVKDRLLAEKVQTVQLMEHIQAKQVAGAVGELDGALVHEMDLGLGHLEPALCCVWKSRITDQQSTQMTTCGTSTQLWNRSLRLPPMLTVAQAASATAGSKSVKGDRVPMGRFHVELTNDMGAPVASIVVATRLL